MPDSLQRDLDASYDQRVLARTAGAIQPHGCLIVVDQRWRNVMLTSTNLDQFLGQAPVEALGRSPSAVLGSVPIGLLASRFGKGEEGRASTATCRLETTPQPLHVTAHGVATSIVLELEPCGILTDNLTERVAGWGSRIAGADCPGRVLSLLLAALRELTGLETAEAYRIDDDGHLQRLVVDDATDPVHKACGAFPVGLSRPTGSLFSGSTPLRLIADTTASPIPLTGPGADALDLSQAVLRSIPVRDRNWLRQLQAHTALVINLYDGQRRWGLIACHGRQARYLAPRLRQLLQLLTHTAFQRHALLQEREESLRRRQLLATAGQIGVRRPRRPSNAALLAAAKACKHYFQACGVALVYQGKALGLGKRPHAQTLQQLAAHLDRCSPDALWHSHRLANTALGKVLPPQGDFSGLLAAPLASEAQPAGWLMLFRQPTGRRTGAQQSDDLQTPHDGTVWSTADQHAAVELARMLSNDITIWRARHRCRRLHERNARLRHLARTDPVAGIANRHRIEELLKAELAIAEHGGKPCSLLMFDIDHFKRINDSHGHDAGDSVLRQVARTVQARLRTSDHLGRWGGEEFLIIAPDCTLRQATELAARLCQDRLETPFPAVGQVSISIGVTAWQPGDTSSQLVHRADMAMYQAKEAGRACVRVAEAAD
ncbi:diguanylate cyclase [Halomonas chromatireducens]|uniref:diguanylate cyclase n=1 Tax=Halomonas chromatireducens TaxID=507626 RepID=A0A0X8HHE9_9GAMM|nr:sensor domain-containing diguanylate cyclase [Halomonas chromatireducens]AMD02660.1 Response regulator PleD [Halomonas chromatireducens]